MFDVDLLARNGENIFWIIELSFRKHGSKNYLFLEDQISTNNTLDSMQLHFLSSLILLWKLHLLIHGNYTLVAQTISLRNKVGLDKSTSFIWPTNLLSNPYTYLITNQVALLSLPLRPLNIGLRVRSIRQLSASLIDTTCIGLRVRSIRQSSASFIDTTCI